VNRWLDGRSKSWMRGLVLAALLVGNCLAALHVAFEPHSVCPEHGELIDASASIGGGFKAASDDGEPCWTSGESNEAGGHQHCAAGALCYGTATSGASAPATTRPWPSFAGCETGPLEAVVSSEPTFQLAPKHSPPPVRAS
jgi:hypothetical protein